MQDTPNGIPPPAPGLEQEEPELRSEDDIPSDDDKKSPVSAQERTSHKPERE